MFLQTSYQNPVLLSGTNVYKPRKPNKPAFFTVKVRTLVTLVMR